MLTSVLLKKRGEAANLLLKCSDDRQNKQMPIGFVRSFRIIITPDEENFLIRDFCDAAVIHFLFQLYLSPLQRFVIQEIEITEVLFKPSSVNVDALIELRDGK